MSISTAKNITNGQQKAGADFYVQKEIDNKLSIPQKRTYECTH